MITKASKGLKRFVKERDGLIGKLTSYNYILRGTIVKRGNICGKARCRCKLKSKPILHGPYHYLSHRSTKSINMIFLNKKKLFYAVRGVKEYNELIGLIYRISDINFKILRYHYDGLVDE